MEFSKLLTEASNEVLIEAMSRLIDIPVGQRPTNTTVGIFNNSVHKCEWILRHKCNVQSRELQICMFASIK